MDVSSAALSWQPGRLLHAWTKAAGPSRGEHVRLPGYGAS